MGFLGEAHSCAQPNRSQRRPPPRDGHGGTTSPPRSGTKGKSSALREVLNFCYRCAVPRHCRARYTRSRMRRTRIAGRVGRDLTCCTAALNEPSSPTPGYSMPNIEHEMPACERRGPVGAFVVSGRVSGSGWQTRSRSALALRRGRGLWRVVVGAAVAMVQGARRGARSRRTPYMRRRGRRCRRAAAPCRQRWRSQSPRR